MITSARPGTPVVFASSAAAEAQEQRSPEALVDAIYRQILKRPADDSGLEYYSGQIEVETISVRDVVRDLLYGDEWAARFIDGRPVEETVLALYDCVLARAPDVDGWNQLTSWEPRIGWRSVIESMIDGAEYTDRFGADIVPGEASQPPVSDRS